MTAAGLALTLLSGCATLPSSGPTRHEVEHAAPGGKHGMPFRLVPLNLAAATSLQLRPASPGQAKLAALASSAPLYRIDAIRTGDELKISVFEVGVALYAPQVGAATGMPAAAERVFTPRVRENGTIDLPYLGSFRAADLYPEQLASEIRGRLQRLSEDPQVTVGISGSVNNGVYVQGSIARAGRYPVTEAREKILDIIALAGGTTIAHGDARIKFVRGDFVVDMPLDEIGLETLANLTLLPGDRITIEKYPRTFTVFGAAEKIAQVPFDSPNVTLAEAIARATGPSDNRADPRGVFLFRLERNADGTIRTPVVYEVDMLRPDSYFTTQMVQMRDKDVLLFAKARSNMTTKLITMLNQLFSPIMTGLALDRALNRY